MSHPSQWTEVNAIVASLTKTQCPSKLAKSTLNVKLGSDAANNPAMQPPSSSSSRSVARCGGGRRGRPRTAPAGRLHGGSERSDGKQCLGGERRSDEEEEVFGSGRDDDDKDGPNGGSSPGGVCDSSARPPDMSPSDQQEADAKRCDSCDGGATKGCSDGTFDDSKSLPTSTIGSTPRQVVVPAEDVPRSEEEGAPPLVACFGFPRRQPAVVHAKSSSSSSCRRSDVPSHNRKSTPCGERGESRSGRVVHVSSAVIRPGSDEQNRRLLLGEGRGALSSSSSDVRSLSRSFSLLREMDDRASSFDYEKEGRRMPFLPPGDRPGSAPDSVYCVAAEVRRRCRRKETEEKEKEQKKEQHSRVLRVVVEGADNKEGGRDSQQHPGPNVQRSVYDRLHAQSLQGSVCAGEHLKRVSRGSGEMRRRYSTGGDDRTRSLSAPGRQQRQGQGQGQRRQSSSTSSPKRMRMDMKEHYLLDREWRDQLREGRGTEWRRRIDREAEDERGRWQKDIKRKVTKRKEDGIASHERYAMGVIRNLHDRHDSAQRHRIELDDAVIRMYKGEEERLSCLREKIQHAKKCRPSVPVRLRWEVPPPPLEEEEGGKVVAGRTTRWRLDGHSMNEDSSLFSDSLPIESNSVILTTRDDFTAWSGGAQQPTMMLKTLSQQAAERIYHRGCQVPPAAPFGSRLDRLLPSASGFGPSAPASVALEGDADIEESSPLTPILEPTMLR